MPSEVDAPNGRVHCHRVSGLPARPFLIGVAGGSSSGKTTAAERLAELAGEEHLALIKLDSYYVELGDLTLEERRELVFDHPDAFDWPLLAAHLAALAAGAPVPVPVYDYVQYNRSGDVRVVRPASIVVVEGVSGAVGALATGALRSQGVHRHRRRPAVHPPPAT